MAIVGTGFYLAGNVGLAVGATVTNSILHLALKRELDEKLKDAEIIKNAVSNIGYVNGLTGRTRDVVVSAYVHGLTYTHGEYPFPFPYLLPTAPTRSLPTRCPFLLTALKLPRWSSQYWHYC